MPVSRETEASAEVVSAPPSPIEAAIRNVDARSPEPSPPAAPAGSGANATEPEPSELGVTGPVAEEGVTGPAGVDDTAGRLAGGEVELELVPVCASGVVGVGSEPLDVVGPASAAALAGGVAWSLGMACLTACPESVDAAESAVVAAAAMESPPAGVSCGDASTAAEMVGPSTGAEVGAEIPGPSTGAEVTGPSTGAEVAGTSVGPEVANPSAGAGVGALVGAGADGVAAGGEADGSVMAPVGGGVAWW